MTQSKIDDLLDNLHQLQSQLEGEIQKLLEEKQAQFHYTLRKGKVTFAREIKKLHKAQRINVFIYIFGSRIGHLLTAPIIYSVAVPIALLDLAVTIYQQICFRAYGIPRVKRTDYIIIDRHQLAYLNIIEKLNCVYCGYGNGVIEYAREITARTEQYWCPIKHARLARSSHERVNNFIDYANAEDYRERLKELRQQVRQQQDQSTRTE